MSLLQGARERAQHARKRSVLEYSPSPAFRRAELSFLRCLVSGNRNDIREAITALEATERSKLDDPTEKIISAESLLMRSILCMLNDQQVRSGWCMRKSFKLYESMQPLIYMDEYNGALIDPNLRSSIQFGVGFFYLWVSSLGTGPSIVVRLLGLTGNRDQGIKMLQNCILGRGARSGFALLFYLFYLVVMTSDVAANRDRLLKEAEELIARADAFISPTNVALLKWMESYIAIKRGETQQAISLLRISVERSVYFNPQAAVSGRIYSDSISADIGKWKPIRLYGELAWCLFLEMQWEPAVSMLQAIFSSIDNADNTPNCLMALQLGVGFAMLGQLVDSIEVLQRVKDFSKGSPFEKLLIRRAERYQYRSAAGVFFLELVYLFGQLRNMKPAWLLTALDLLDDAAVVLNQRSDQQNQYPNGSIRSLFNNQIASTDVEEDAVFLLIKGAIHRALGNKDEARGCLESAVSMQPYVTVETFVNGYSRYELGALLVDSEERQDGVELLQEVEKRYSNVDFGEPLKERVTATLKQLRKRSNRSPTKRSSWMWEGPTHNRSYSDDDHSPIKQDIHASAWVSPHRLSAVRKPSIALSPHNRPPSVPKLDLSPVSVSTDPAPSERMRISLMNMSVMGMSPNTTPAGTPREEEASPPTSPHKAYPMHNPAPAAAIPIAQPAQPLPSSINSQNSQNGPVRKVSMASPRSRFAPDHSTIQAGSQLGSSISYAYKLPLSQHPPQPAKPAMAAPVPALRLPLDGHATDSNGYSNGHPSSHSSENYPIPIRQPMNPASIPPRSEASSTPTSALPTARSVDYTHSPSVHSEGLKEKILTALQRSITGGSEVESVATDRFEDDSIPLTARERLSREKIAKERREKLDSVRKASQPDAVYDAYCDVTETLAVGGDPAARNYEHLFKMGVTHILNLQGSFCDNYHSSTESFTYVRLFIKDDRNANIQCVLFEIIEFCETVAQNNGKVFIHCLEGSSLSTAFVIGLLMHQLSIGCDQANQYLRSLYSRSNPSPCFLNQLQQWDRRRSGLIDSPILYRIAPHEQEDPSLLILKADDCSKRMLDSRGVYLLQVNHSLYVWFGSRIESVPVQGRAARYQRALNRLLKRLAKYERISDQFISVQEGAEPAEFWTMLGQPLKKGTCETDYIWEYIVDEDTVTAHDLEVEPPSGSIRASPSRELSRRISAEKVVLGKIGSEAGSTPKRDRMSSRRVSSEFLETIHLSPTRLAQGDGFDTDANLPSGSPALNGRSLESKKEYLERRSSMLSSSLLYHES